MENFKEILQAYKKSFQEELEVNTMEVLEEINPRLTSDSKTYKHGNKYIFKAHISYEKAGEILNTVMNTSPYSIENLKLYKDKIQGKLTNSFIGGENPIEVLIYSTIGLKDEIYKNAILDLLKDIALDYREEMVEAYTNILNNWLWVDCIDLVLKSIEQNLLTELIENVYEIFLRSEMLRERSAIVLINMDAEIKYESLINFLVANTNENSESIDSCRNIMYRLGKNTRLGSAYVYKVYNSINCRSKLRNILIMSIKQNITKSIYDNIEKRLANPELASREHNKLIYVLERSLGESGISLGILNKALSYDHLDKDKIKAAIGAEDVQMQIDIINDETVEDRTKINSIIKLGKVKNTQTIEILRSFKNQPDNIQIAIASALVERGEKRELITLFKYLVNSDNNELVYEATNQIKRLIAMGKEDINEDLIKVISRFLENNEEKAIDKTLKVIEIYTTGKPQQEVGEIFLKKLKQSDFLDIKKKLLVFFKHNYNVFSEDLKRRIKEEIIYLSKLKGIAQESMEVLNDITSREISLPEYKK